MKLTAPLQNYIRRQSTIRSTKILQQEPIDFNVRRRYTHNMETELYWQAVKANDARFDGAFVLKCENDRHLLPAVVPGTAAKT
jgi:hypothetical protein